MSTASPEINPFLGIWKSLLAVPLWVQLWLVVMGAVNMASLAFLDQPSGELVAILVFAGVIIGVGIAIQARGFNRLVGVGHLIAWIPLVLIIIFARPEGTETYQIFLTMLAVVNTISILFDANDFRLWLAGDRAVFA